MTPDDSLEEAFEALEPSAAQRSRIEDALEPVFSARPRSLTMEWVDLLRLRPALHGTLALGASALLWGTSPLAALSLALVRALR